MSIQYSAETLQTDFKGRKNCNIRLAWTQHALLFQNCRNANTDANILQFTRSTSLLLMSIGTDIFVVTLSIHPLSYPTVLRGPPVLISAHMGRRHSLSSHLGTILSVQSTRNACLWAVGGNWSTWIKTQADTARTCKLLAISP